MEIDKLEGLKSFTVTVRHRTDMGVEVHSTTERTERCQKFLD